LVGAASRLLLDLDVKWHAPLPHGPKIVAANHPSTSDPGLVMLVARGQCSALISETLFKVPLFGRYLHAAGHIPVIDGNGRAALEGAKRRLQNGQTVMIFPEGSISPREGGVYPARTGVARLALSTGAPVIPVGIYLDRARLHLMETVVDGKLEVGTWYLHGPYAMTVGKPMILNGNMDDWAYVRALSQQVMQRIAHLAQESESRMRQQTHRTAYRGIYERAFHHI
ncbi:MAG: 1-acyl-sn-glycerol-3-phosphate acyltransferase, partial [Anaerolineae bacterium]|nr:1-acyl-sn-glycerol-3-phosphate acyltransferase [Anaerolineae bacterium]